MNSSKRFELPDFDLSTIGIAAENHIGDDENKTEKRRITRVCMNDLFLIGASLQKR